MTTLVDKKYVSHIPGPSSWHLRGVNRGSQPLLGPMKVNLTIGGHPFLVMAFVADTDDELILGHNFIYPHDLCPNPGKKVIAINKGSDGAALKVPVTVPYTLKNSAGIRSAVIYQPVRACTELKVQAGEIMHLDQSTLRSINLSLPSGTCAAVPGRAEFGCRASSPGHSGARRRLPP